MFFFASVSVSGSPYLVFSQLRTSRVVDTPLCALLTHLAHPDFVLGSWQGKIFQTFMFTHNAPLGQTLDTFRVIVWCCDVLKGSYLFSFAEPEFFSSLDATGYAYNQSDQLNMWRDFQTLPIPDGNAPLSVIQSNMPHIRWMVAIGQIWIRSDGNLFELEGGPTQLPEQMSSCSQARPYVVV